MHCKILKANSILMIMAANSLLFAEETLGFSVSSLSSSGLMSSAGSKWRGADSKRRRIDCPSYKSSHRSLFVDMQGDDGYLNQEVIASSKSNEWGIPKSSLLPPFATSPMEELENGGRVTLVGSGPGDPDLLTVKALKLLEDPNSLVICDRLVSKEIVDLVRGEVKVARKLPGCAELAQEEIYWWAHQGLQQGKHVIRLKIGDPFVFGRGGEEVLTFRRLGVKSNIVPGVSAAFAAPLLGNIPVTHRGVSNQVVMCTGYGREGTSPDLIQYHKEQTVVFLMAVGRLGELCERLVQLAGYPVDTPVGIIEKAGCPDQRTVVGSIETIADIAKKYEVQAPSTIVVGGVVHVLLDEGAEGQSARGLIQDLSIPVTE